MSNDSNNLYPDPLDQDVVESSSNVYSSTPMQTLSLQESLSKMENSAGDIVKGSTSDVPSTIAPAQNFEQRQEQPPAQTSSADYAYYKNFGEENANEESTRENEPLLRDGDAAAGSINNNVDGAANDGGGGSVADSDQDPKKKKKSDTRIDPPNKIRNLVAFFICGLINNFSYVVMLSAAEDMV